MNSRFKPNIQINKKKNKVQIMNLTFGKIKSQNKTQIMKDFNHHWMVVCSFSSFSSVSYYIVFNVRNREIEG